ncbi:MAG: caspase family protein [Alphaproteobacteria bacterium]|nr:caspase family protein [Alphaproteobacteria bacterium]
MRVTRSLALATLLLTPSALTAQESGKLYAVVVGISDYPGLPAEAALPGARGEASRLALQLREEAGYADVRLLTDSSATREAITAALRDDLGNRVGYDDTLLFYFVGHGIGRDFDDPYLLTYDSQQGDLPGSAWSAAELGATIRELVPAGNYLIVTDASHAGSLNGLKLLGPTADSWPDMGPSAFMMSATQASQPSAAGVFAKDFMDAITGGADDNDDGQVSVNEISRYLQLTVPFRTENHQYISTSGRYDGEQAVSMGVLFKDTIPPELFGVDPSEAPLTEQEILGYSVDKVKFVFRDAREPVVSCRSVDPKPCENQCYLWDIPAGTCEVSAYVGSKRVTGKALVVARGAYVCEPAGESLNCVSPR